MSRVSKFYTVPSVSETMSRVSKFYTVPSVSEKHIALGRGLGLACLGPSSDHDLNDKS